MFEKLAKVAGEATVYFVGGILACLVHWWLVGTSTEFASRWTGTCQGWDKWLVIENIVGALLTWWAYTAIAVTIYRLHPVVESIQESRWTIMLTGTFVILCGGTHLLIAYTDLNPVYRFSTHFQLFAAVVSDISVFFIAAGLIRVFAQIQRARELRERRLAELEAKESQR